MDAKLSLMELYVLWCQEGLDTALARPGMSAYGSSKGRIKNSCLF